jgi:hypothetical protein
MDKVLHDGVHIQRAAPHPTAPFRGKPPVIAYIYERLFKCNPVWSERDKGMRHKSFSILIRVDPENESASTAQLRIWSREDDKWTTIYTMHHKQMMSMEQLEEVPSHHVRSYHFSADAEELTEVAKNVCGVSFCPEVWDAIRNPMAGLQRDVNKGIYQLDGKPFVIVMKESGDEFTGTIVLEKDDPLSTKSWIAGSTFDMMVRKEDEKILDEPVRKTFNFRDIHCVEVI